MKKIIFFLALCTSLGIKAQELDNVQLGVVKGELEYYHGVLNWVNNNNDTVRGSYWTDRHWMLLPTSSFEVPPGDSLIIDYRVDLQQLRGIYQAEIRLLDEEQIILHGFLVGGRFQEPDTTALQSYRNDHFPFKSKSQVFNLGATYNNDLLTKEFVVHNFGGDSLDLSNIKTDHIGLTARFYPAKVAHNEFIRMELTYRPDVESVLGFTRRNIKILDENESLLAVIPIQYTLVEYVAPQSSAPDMAVSKVNHDFRVIEVGAVEEISIVIANNGNADLVIRKVESNCQCLSYELPDQTIKPGEKTSLTVTFNAAERLGYERKTLAIFSNDPRKPTEVLVFRAHVK